VMFCPRPKDETAQSPLHLSGSVEVRYPTVTVNTPRLNLSEFYTLLELSILTFFSVEIVRWVAESKRPFKIVNDRGFQSLIKTGRPEYYIPSPETISCNVKRVFVRVCQRIAKMLQVC